MIEQFEQAAQLRGELKASHRERDLELSSSLHRRVNRLYRSEDWMVRYEVVLGVVEGRLKSSLPLLRRALFCDPSALIRHDCAFGIGEMGSLKDQELLIRALKDPEPIVRHEAASALEGIGDGRAVQAVGSLLNDEDEEVRHTARLVIQLMESRLSKPV